LRNAEGEKDPNGRTQRIIASLTERGDREKRERFFFGGGGEIHETEKGFSRHPLRLSSRRRGSCFSSTSLLKVEGGKWALLEMPFSQARSREEKLSLS